MLRRLFPGRLRPHLDPLKLRSLLIIKLSSIGDVVQAMPVACALHRRFPSARITWVAEDWTAPLISNHPAVNRVVMLPSLKWAWRGRRWLGALATALRELRADSYDVAIDLQGLFKSSVAAVLSRAPIRIGIDFQREGAHLFSYGVPGSDRNAAPHAVYEYLSVAEFLGASGQPVVFGLKPQAHALDSVNRLLAEIKISNTNPLITVSPAASVRWKGWPVGRWAELVDSLSTLGSVVLVGSANQRAWEAQIVGRSRSRPARLAGRTSLRELVALLSLSDLHIAPDTGSAHIAAALAVPVIGIYGPTSPKRLGPFGQEDLIVYHGEVCGAGCPKFCFRGRRCLDAATPDEVIEGARRALNRRPARRQPNV